MTAGDLEVSRPARPRSQRSPYRMTFSQSLQKKYFNANCRMRVLGGMDLTKRVAVQVRLGIIQPNRVGNVERLARNSSFCLSFTWKRSERATSNCQLPGPRILLAAIFPRCPSPAERMQ